jgi:hypothetical protein
MIQEYKIFSIKEKMFILGGSRLYILYQLELRKVKHIRVVTCITRKKDIRADIIIDLMCNTDMLVIDNKKNKKQKMERKDSNF